MMGLGLPPGPLEVLCLGAHPDDIEIGCGGTLLELAVTREIVATFAVLTSDTSRKIEAQKAAASVAPGSTVRFADLPDGFLPTCWSEAKRFLEAVALTTDPDVVFCPRPDDAHQDHRTLAELTTTVWRDSFVLRYEIPKWDGDWRPTSMYVPVRDTLARRKVELLGESFVSQRDRDWWDDETFLGLMRMRGVECRHRYAEGFVVDKAVVDTAGWS